MKKMRINIVSESAISVQGHGVHTAYEEMARSLEDREDIEVIRGEFGKTVDCDIIHIHTIGTHTWRKLLQPGPKKVISAHVVPESFVGSLAMARAWLFIASWYMRWFYNRADLLIAVSDKTRQDLLALGVTTPLVIEHNSIDTRKYQNASKAEATALRRQLGIPLDATVVMGAGQIQPRKRLDSFIAAAKKLPDIYFVWVGGMPFGKLAADSANMTKLVKNAPKNVIFPGIVPLDDMPKYYQAANIFWLPSIQETFGLVITEAAAAGLPIVLRRLPDYQDTFEGDVIQCDEQGFAPAIKKLATDKDYYKTWQRHSEAIAKRFDSATAAERIVTLYRDLL